MHIKLVPCLFLITSCMYGMEYERRHQRVSDLHTQERKREQLGFLAMRHKTQRQETIIVGDGYKKVEFDVYEHWLQRKQALEALHKNT